MKWLPKTNIGKISFYVGILAFILIYVQYWTAMFLQSRGIGTRFILPGILAIICVLAAGVGSVAALIKYKDRAILLFVSAFIGLLGFLLVIGELLFPH